MHSNVWQEYSNLHHLDTLTYLPSPMTFLSHNKLCPKGVLWCLCQEIVCWGSLTFVFQTFVRFCSAFTGMLCSLAWLKAASYLVRIPDYFPNLCEVLQYLHRILCSLARLKAARCPTWYISLKRRSQGGKAARVSTSPNTCTREQPFCDTPLRQTQVTDHFAGHAGSAVNVAQACIRVSCMLTRTSSGSLTASGPAMASKQEFRAAGVRAASSLSSLHAQP